MLHLAACLLALATPPADAGDTKPLIDWVLLPDYTLPASGANELLARPPQPVSEPGPLTVATRPLELFGEMPTERRAHLAPGADLRLEAFTIELWLLDHVNQPVGALAAVRDAATGEPVFSLGYHGKRLHTQAARVGFADSAITVSDLPRRGWKKWWRHIVATHDGRTLRLYHNGELAGELETGPIAMPEGELDLELAAYMQAEPYMDLENLVKSVRIWDHGADPDEIASMLTGHQAEVDAGVRIPGVFHWNAGPYLHMATPESINLSWETDRPSTAVIQYGPRAPLEHTLEITDAATIHDATLTGLTPDSPYFYRLTSTDAQGQTLDSGLLTFKTAALPGAPIRFAVMGDPEARPHINDRVAKLIWDERPDFMLQVGDLTDGGQTDHKYEWNQEYYLAMDQLNSRVPVYPVPGNGESDLHWYSRYHKLPSPDEREGYYTFSYADIQFFMLDSNQREEQFKSGGEQYEWLEAELKKSTAKWKIAAHHHPVYTSDEDDYGDTFDGQGSTLGDTRVRQIMDLYEKYGVDVVFFGHLHSYERTLPMRNGKPTPGGVMYVQAGGGGGNLEDHAPTPTWFSGRVHRGHHFVMCYLFDDALEIRMYSTEQALLDFAVIEK